MKLLKLRIKIYNITKQMMLLSGYLDSNYIYIYILRKNESLEEQSYFHHDPE